MHQGPLPHIGPEAEVPGMITTAGGPFVDRTPTGGGETLVLTSAPVAEEPRWEPAMVETFTPRFGAVTQDSKVETSPGQVRPAIIWGQGIQIRLATHLVAQRHQRLVRLLSVTPSRDCSKRKLASRRTWTERGQNTTSSIACISEFYLKMMYWLEKMRSNDR